MRYEKTEDPNIIKQIEVVESEIYLDKLEKQVTELETEISSLPKPKTKPDQETLACYNEHIDMLDDKEGLENNLREKKNLLNELKSL